ncbi:uncharacterized protein LOC100829637 [Brachypodium distachyon]|uniref:Uncharacterized protein n=1 Tax=Brachypodium distachyon TaxID=15368 RepID=I1IU99_BRADI|nr:uncharacterized protein LOC100829637 [Brachypodium distachyon]KQJ92214.1 hypothetical protein BRADI_4g42280v3 [Brachypodium distachyon]|eukprot:XP_003577036.1 uncharacterized protein LOC100829637 [Brachypodium distachyon]
MAAAAAARGLAGDPPGSTLRRVGNDDCGAYDRDDSLKENTNPKCAIAVKSSHPAGGGGNSQRFSGNLKPTAAPIIGVSGKFSVGGGGQGCARRQRPPAMFPRKARTGGGGRNPKPAVPEPGSPKVSCIGKVLSASGRERGAPPPKEKTSAAAGSGGCGCWGGGFSIRRSRSRKSAVESVDWSPAPGLPRAYVARRSEAEAPPSPALGGMRRFASGRRGADWAAGMEEGGRVARSGPL